MRYFLIFDIETSPIDWELFSESQKEYWLRNANTEEEIQNRMFQRSLTPFTGMVVCIGMMILGYDGTNWTTIKKGVLATNPIFYSKEDDIQADDNLIEDLIIADEVKMQLSTERKVLEDFWKILNHYKNPTLITFNGRNFDAPFLALRSAIYKIRPPYNIMQGTKFNYPSHIDLIDELSFYSGAQYGATRRFNFDFYAHSFGIVSPKAQGVDGSLVPTFFADGKIKEISEYCMRDVYATWDLFHFWLDYLCFKSV